MKKILAFLLIVGVLASLVLSLGSCGISTPAPEEMRKTYRTVYAKVASTLIGAGEARLPAVAGLSLPSLAGYIPSGDDAMFKSIGGFMEFIRGLYANEAFPVTAEPVSFAYDYGHDRYDVILRSAMDRETGRVTGDFLVKIDDEITQFVNIEVQYDFETETVLSFHIYNSDDSERPCNLDIRFEDGTLTELDFGVDDEARTSALAILAEKREACEAMRNSAVHTDADFGAEYAAAMEIVEG